MTNENEWVRFNHLTQSYETRDGTSVAAEVSDNCYSIADVLRVAIIRDKQRRDVEPPK